MGPGFSERTFEFCYNAEYVQLNQALLATHPHIPSQQAEKDLGYDVEFKLQTNTYTKSIFLQHKVSSFAEFRAGRNAVFYDTHGGPYFRFPVDNDQHNVLCDLSATKGNAFYCAPQFHLSHQLEQHFRAASIGLNVLLLDPLQVGRINDADRHNITYNPLGGNATLHSEPRRFEKTYGGGKENPPPLKSQRVTAEYVAALRDELLAETKRLKIRPTEAAEVEKRKPVEQVQLLLGRFYQVTWLLLP